MKIDRGEYRSIYGDSLTKIYKFSKDNPDLFESDVVETTRVLVDTYSDSDDISKGHVVLKTYDIEVEMESGLPDTQKSENEITSIINHDSLPNNIGFWLWIRVVRWLKRKLIKSNVLPFQDERDLLQKYLELYEMINPSIVTGWNIDYFDTPYLYNRIKRLMGERQTTDYHQLVNVSGLLTDKDSS